jgi:hypothetical protein
MGAASLVRLPVSQCYLVLSVQCTCMIPSQTPVLQLPWLWTTFAKHVDFLRVSKRVRKMGTVEWAGVLQWLALGGIPLLLSLVVRLSCRFAVWAVTCSPLNQVIVMHSHASGAAGPRQLSGPATIQKLYDQ